jgi:uncharacterized membrane protein
MKNPIIIGVLCGVILFAILYYVNRNKFTETESKKNILIKNGIISAVASVVAWFLYSTYLDNSIKTSNEAIYNNASKVATNPVADNYHALENTIRPPPEEVFLDIGQF